jgi:flagellar hook-associated protein 2
MATISSAGIGSGLDVAGIVSQLMALERRPLEQLGTVTKRYETQLSAFGKLQSAMTTLRDAARKLTDAPTWTPTTVASSNAAVVSASSNGSGPAGSYSISVGRLAAAQTLVSGTAFASAASPVGSGSLVIELGSWVDDPNDPDPARFSAKGGSTPVTVTIAPGSDSLTAVRDAINASGAGVTASIVNDANGARLALRSTATGETNGFRIGLDDGAGGSTPGDGTGLSRLSYPPPAVSAELQATQMQWKLAAANATAVINGVDISSETNTLEDVLDGLTVTLSQVTTAPVSVNVARDNVAMKKSVTDFATAYNDLQKLLREQTRFNETNKTAGALQGDRSAVGLMSTLRNLVGSSSAASTAFTRLADIGLEPQSDGSLKVNDSKLDAALGRLSELKAFFSANAEGTAADGFGVMLRDFGNSALDSEGVLTTRQEGLKERISRNGESATRLEDRLALVEKRLRDQYTRLDTNMARLKQLEGYVGQQIANWNKSTG